MCAHKVAPQSRLISECTLRLSVMTVNTCANIHRSMFYEGETLCYCFCASLILLILDLKSFLWYMYMPTIPISQPPKQFCHKLVIYQIFKSFPFFFTFNLPITPSIKQSISTIHFLSFASFKSNVQTYLFETVP